MTTAKQTTQEKEQIMKVIPQAIQVLESKNHSDLCSGK